MLLNNKQNIRLLWKFIFPIQLALVILLTTRLTTILLGGGASYQEFHNSHCLKDNDLKELQTTLNGTVDECAYDYNFKKVLFFWCDGISWDTADPIFANFPSNNHLFKVRHKENPWSAWVFATFMTGKAERNMGEIKNDNLMYQFWLSGKKVYIGAEDTRAYVFDQLDLDYNKKSGDIKFWDKVSADETRMFHWLFECKESESPEECANATLDQGKADDRSMFLESFILDHKVHDVNSKYGTLAIALRDRLAQDLAIVKKWVDDNPEYLLVIVSDHGQKVSNAEIAIHGNWLADGNEGWVLAYNPTFDFAISTYDSPIILNTVDVAPTLWQFFSASGVSIPAESVGKVYPITTSVTNRYNALYVNALQMQTYLKRDTPFQFGDSLLNQAKQDYENKFYEKAADNLDNYVSELSDKFITEGEKLPYKTPLFVALFHLAFTLAIQFGSWDAVWACARTVGYGVLASPYLTWLVIAVFFAQSTDMAARNQVYAYAIPMVAYLASFTYKRLSESPPIPTQKKGHQLLEFELLEKDKVGKGEEGEGKGEGVDTLDDGNECGKSIEIDIPTTEAKQYLYFQIWDNCTRRKFVEGLTVFVKYIFGAHKIPRSPVDFWLMYAVVVFAVFACCEIAFINKRFIFADIGALHGYPEFWHPLAMMVLFFEFRWQRILLTTNLQLEPSRFPLLQQIIHPSFWLLNVKTVLYFVLLVYAFDAQGATARCIYGVTITHIVVLLFCPVHLQRDLFLPLFILTFVVNTSREKILLSLYAVVLHFFSNAFEKSSPLNRHLLPSVLVTILALGHYYFSVLYQLPYSINQIDLSIPGIDDVTKYPDFSVMMMGVHYLGVFLILIPFLVRLVAPSPPPLRPIKIGRLTFGHMPVCETPDPSEFSPVDHSKRFVMTFLVFCSSLSVFLYYMFSISERSDIPLIWTFMICTVTIGYGATVVCSELMGALCEVLIFLKNYILPKLIL